MKPFFQVQQRALYPLWRRLRDHLSRIFYAEPRELQRLHLVTINGHRFKRVILNDTYRAATIQRKLESFGPSKYFPKFVMCLEKDVWVEFIDGTKARHIDEHFVRLAADLYNEIYSRQPLRVETSSTRFPRQLEMDLGFLNQVGMLNDTAHSDLQTAAVRLAPDHVWTGFDYSDPLLKNLIVTPDGKHICAVDVESLNNNKLLGSGIAKALAFWLGPHRALFFECIAHREAPDFASYFPFVELVFLARWTKGNILKEKWTLVDSSKFDRFRSL